MPSWIETFQEIQARTNAAGIPDLDGIRRERYARLAEYTGRPLIVYAADFLNRQKVQQCGGDIQIDLSDRDGMIEVTRSLDARAVDVLIQSPGGLPDAADTLVHILRGRYKSVRFIVMGVAKSAATMMAMSGDRILLDQNAELGPIDPQFQLQRGDGTIVRAPAQAIIDQFEKAQGLIGNEPTRLPAWLPILQQYGPALYQQCQTAISLSKDYVHRYLTTWMFRRSLARDDRAQRVVDYLGDHNTFKTHGARIGYKELKLKGVRVDLVNADARLVSLLEDVMYAIMFTFNMSAAYKIFENSNGQALIRASQVVQLPAHPGSQG
jgi:hypothetical protein